MFLGGIRLLRPRAPPPIGSRKPRPPSVPYSKEPNPYRPLTSFPRRRESSDLRPPRIQLKRTECLWCRVSLGYAPPTVPSHPPRTRSLHLCDCDYHTAFVQSVPYFHFPSRSYHTISIRPSSIRCSCNSRSDHFFPFFRLHGPHNNPKFVITSRPFLSFGFRWSTCK